MIGNNILIVVDDKPDANIVLEEGLDLCTKLGVQPTIVTVLRHASESEKLQQALRRRIKALFPNMADLEVLTPTGDPAREVRRVAQRSNADLIVIGNHAETGLGLFLGSTANVVLHDTPCHVLAITLRSQANKNQV